MSEDAALEASLHALGRYLVGDATMHDTLTRVAELTTEVVPAAAFAGITMAEGGEVRTGVFTDPSSPEIDQAQYDTGEGPCLDAFRSGEVVRVDSTRLDDRYPEYSRACVEHGILSTLSLPLKVDDRMYGALNLYATDEAAFGAEQAHTAGLFATQAAVVLANASAYWGARARVEQLQQAMATRGPIEQAKGIIMATLRCDADEAFEILVKQSQNQNRKLTEIAAEIIRNTTSRHQHG